MSTAELDALAEQTIRDGGACPPSSATTAIPATICASVNEEIVHGIPSAERVLADGDLISVDCGAILEGWHGDAAVTIAVGSVSGGGPGAVGGVPGGAARGHRGRAPGGRLSDISHAVQTPPRRPADRDGVKYGIVAEYGGHGIGTSMHMDPFLPNFGDPGQGPRLAGAGAGGGTHAHRG